MAEEKGELPMDDSENHSSMNSSEKSQEGGTSLMQRLRIPFVTSVVDNSSGEVVSLGNRQVPMGLANINYHGMFVTADEHVALESGTPSDAAWLMGFTIDPNRSHLIAEKYPELEYPVPVTIGTQSFSYFRNFPLRDTCTLKTSVGYVTYVEYAYIHDMDRKERMALVEYEPLNITNTPSEPDTASDWSELPVKKLQHIQSPFGRQSVLTWWNWVLQNQATQQISVENCTFAIAEEIDIQMNSTAQPNGDWRQWSPLQFYTRSMELFILTSESSHLQSVLGALTDWLDIGPDFLDQEPFNIWNQKILSTLKQTRADNLSVDENKEAAHHVYNLLAVEALDKDGVVICGPRYLFKKSIRKSFKLDEDEFKTFFATPQDTLKAVCNAVKDRIKQQLAFNNIGCGQATTATTRISNHEEMSTPAKIHKSQPKGEPKGVNLQTLNSLSNATDACRGCGKVNTCPTRDQQRCVFKQHPGFNKEPKAWKESTMGKLYATKVPNGANPKGRETLAANFVPTASKFDVEAMSDALKATLTTKGVPFPESSRKRSFDSAQGRGGRGNNLSTHFDILASYTTNKDASYLRPFTLCLPQAQDTAEEGRNTDNITVKGLVDSGAVHASYISIALALHLDELKVLKQVVNRRVCTGIKGSQQCSDSSHAYDVRFDFVNERTLIKEHITIRAQMIDSQFDLIIGQPDIFQLI